ncbi:MAG TPA: alkane 1-monooxygenase, partial [Novosphingobium sp.]|nr:alkane 1-monooxygenase [Novosphingobium sp.]
YESLPAPHRAMLDRMLECTAIGTEADVAAGLAALVARTQADEVIIGGQIFDHGARRRSFALAAAALQGLPNPA